MIDKYAYKILEESDPEVFSESEHDVMSLILPDLGMQVTNIERKM